MIRNPTADESQGRALVVTFEGCHPSLPITDSVAELVRDHTAYVESLRG